MSTTADLSDPTRARLPGRLPERGPGGPGGTGGGSGPGGGGGPGSGPAARKSGGSGPGTGPGSGSGPGPGTGGRTITLQGYESPSLRTPVVREPDWATDLRRQIVRQVPGSGLAQVMVSILDSHLQVHLRDADTTMVLLLPHRLAPLRDQLLLVEGMRRQQGRYQWGFDAGFGNLHVSLVVPGSTADSKVVATVVAEARALVDAVLALRPLWEGQQHPLHWTVWMNRFQTVRHLLQEYIRRLAGPPYQEWEVVYQDRNPDYGMIPRFRQHLQKALSLETCDKLVLLNGILNGLPVSGRLIGLLEADVEACTHLREFAPSKECQRFRELAFQRKLEWQDLQQLANSLQGEHKDDGASTATKPTRLQRCCRQESDGSWHYFTKEVTDSSPSLAQDLAKAISRPSSPAESGKEDKAADEDGKAPAEPPPAPAPQELARRIGERVIGQPEAVRAMAVALHLHLSGTRRMGSLLMTGPTGCGKSHLAQVCADIAGVPMRHVNAATLVPTGIVGEDLTDVLRGLLTCAENDKDKAERSIVIFDEIDKLTMDTDIARYGQTILFQLLRLIDGCDWHMVDGEGRSSKDPTQQTFNTRRLLIVLAGAWSNLRQEEAPTIGFTSQDAGEAKSATPDIDLTKLGLPPEFMGRICRMVQMQPHSQESLREILTRPATSPFALLEERLKTQGHRLEVSPDIINRIIERALASGLGARALSRDAHRITEEVLWQLDTATKGDRVVHLAPDLLKDGT